MVANSEANLLNYLPEDRWGL